MQAVENVAETFRQAEKYGQFNMSLMERCADLLVCDIMSKKKNLVQITDIRLHDSYTFSHSVNVAVLATMLGNLCGYSKSKLQVITLGGLLHDIGKPKTRRFEKDGSVSFLQHDVVGARMVKKRMRALRFDNDTIKAVARLVELHMRFYGYREAGWTDSAVRRCVRDAGEQLQRLHRLSRSDVTTRNKRMARSLAQAYDDLERRIDELAAQEELDAMRPELDGEQIMAVLGIDPGPLVGQAYKFLLNLRLDEGELGEEEATRRLLVWWQEHGES